MTKLPIEYNVKNKIGPVKNQGNEETSVGFAGVLVKEYQERKKGGKNDKFI